MWRDPAYLLDLYERHTKIWSRVSTGSGSDLVSHV
jgi:hypothetical protein